MNKQLAPIFLMLMLLFSVPAWTQETEPLETEDSVESVEEEKSNWRDKVFFGGGGGLQFSNFATFVSVMPSVGYRITTKFSSGVTAIYQYVNFRGIDESAHYYGGSLFSRYFVLPQVYAAAEYEKINFQIFSADRGKYRQWVDRALLGAGYYQQTGRRGGFHIGIMYDLLYDTNKRADPYYPYNSPLVYRIGLIF